MSPFDTCQVDLLKLPCVPAMIAVVAAPAADDVVFAVESFSGQNDVATPLTAVRALRHEVESLRHQ